MPQYTNLTVASPSALKRFSHLRRFDVAIELLDVASGERVLDFGAGDGYLIQRLAQLGRGVAIVGYEPVPRMFEDLSKRLDGEAGVQIFQYTEELAPPFDKIVCLEVLEHLPEHLQREALRNMHGLLTDGGAVIISVPIEIGLSSLAKNLARIAISQRHDGTTLRNILKSTFYGRVERPHRDFISSHIGFHYQDLEALFSEEGLEVCTSVCSPIRPLGRTVNSQVFYVLRKSNKV